ncbi:hypothetical protein K439DRAFT_1663900 [Ramaria rubella]|nr:hypothetical protein K439DRAFT_1663900 [Ramaria rubella]
MCLGNRASDSADYINNQLDFLWRLSAKCVEKHGRGVKATKTEVEYGSCLAQICLGQQDIKPVEDGLDFFATFGAAPELKFICNHEVVLLLHLKSGHYKLKLGEKGSLKDKNSLQRIEAITCAFRLQFSEHLITPESFSTFGQTPNPKTKLLVLDIDNATFIPNYSPLFNEQNVGPIDADHLGRISDRLKTHYLPLLRMAGFHCLHALPDFGSAPEKYLVDYSVVSEIDIENNNTITQGHRKETALSIKDFKAGTLAEQRGTYKDIDFRITCGFPEVRELCSKEALLYIDVREVTLEYRGKSKNANYQGLNWIIVVVMDSHMELSEGGKIRRNFSNARICEDRLLWTSDKIETSILTELQTVVAQYILQSYFIHLSKKYEHRYNFIVDTQATQAMESNTETAVEQVNKVAVGMAMIDAAVTVNNLKTTVSDKAVVNNTKTVNRTLVDNAKVTNKDIVDVTRRSETDIEGSTSKEFKKRLSITDTFGFDLITTVAQGSVNDHFYRIWKSSRSGSNCLGSWTFKEFFSASFGALQIELPIDPKSHSIILYIDLLEGYLNILQNGNPIGSEKYKFSVGRLAFAMTLGFRDFTEPHVISDWLLKARKDCGEYVLKQLILDFSSATSCKDLSAFPRYGDGTDIPSKTSKDDALVWYVQRHYLPQLKQEGHDVLYSFPTWKRAGSSALIRYAPYSFDFQIFPAPHEGLKDISNTPENKQKLGNCNLLVIYGMINIKARPPSPLSRCNWRWSDCDQAFSGMFALSRSAFLDRWLLGNLMRINKRTTLVPTLRGIRASGTWDLELVKWDEDPCNEDESCDWVQVKDRDSALQFEWKNMEERVHTHRGAVSDIRNGHASIFCETANCLVLPVVNDHGACVIQVEGSVELKIAFISGEKNWFTKATARWSAGIRLAADTPGTGLKITSTSKKDIPSSSQYSPNFDMSGFKFKEPSTYLQEQFSDVVLIEEDMIRFLGSAFSEVWPLFYSNAYGYTLGNPVFNASGDLLFDLVPPIDHQGRVVCPQESRPDICLPGKP